MTGVGLRRIADARQTIGSGVTRARNGKRNRVLRIAAEHTQDFLAAGFEDEWPVDQPEPDDAVALDDQAEWGEADDDAPVFDDDAPRLDPRPTWLPTPRLTIFERDGRLDYRVHVPVADAWHWTASLASLEYDWARIAEALISGLPECLRSRTLLDAAHALRVVKDPVTGEAGQQGLAGDGQFNRVRNEVVFTPFGLVPLWFFAVVRKDDMSLWGELEQLGCALVGGARARIAAGRKGLPESLIAEILSWPSIRPASISRQHGKALLAVIDHPEVVALHRSRWPLTSPAALYKDLGLPAGQQGRSVPVATLALVGAFDPAINPALDVQQRGTEE